MKNTRIGGAVRLLAYGCMTIAAILTMHFCIRIFVTDSFCIPSTSMCPTLNPGDRIRVNKFLFGARIYRNFDFSREAGLDCFRMPGLRNIRPGDIIVFNFPFGYDDWSRIEFRINYVFCKRVLGCPGDTIGIAGGRCWNAASNGIIGVAERQQALADTSDSVFISNRCFTSIPLSMPVWNIRDMGPLKVPAKGMTIAMTSFNAALYGLSIEYETGKRLSGNEGTGFFLDGEPLVQYSFCQNWYFALGDNSPDSMDSRYWGFIPEPFIIGIVSGV